MTEIVTERRGFFRILAGGLAALHPTIVRALVKVPPIPPPELPPYVTELNAVVRRAFVPRVVVQTYNSQPMLSLMMAKAKAEPDGHR